MQGLVLFALVGFLAQLVDGAAGMAYGLTATSVLLGLAVAPAVASASVHAAEVFTTAASGYAHWRAGNVDPRLVARLAIPGAIGAAMGAFLLANLEGRYIRPAISLYLAALGLLILYRLWRRERPPRQVKHVSVLGFCGGLLDAIGGGGWGPLVATTLINQGDRPRNAIGSTNAAEFFVTLAATGAFLFSIGLSLWPVILGLVVGGVAAAPIAAWLARVLPARVLLFAVAVVVIGLSARNLAVDLPWLLG